MSNRRLLVILLIVLVLIVLWQFSFVSQFLARGAVSMAAPFWRFENYVTGKAHEYTVLLRRKRTLLEENNRLEGEVALLETRLLGNRLLFQENKELKEILGRRIDERNLLLTVILAKPNRSPYDTLILDSGKKEGVNVGDRVVAYGDIVIGRISRVLGDTSQATLFSSPGEEIAITIGEEHIAARARGIGGGNFKVKLPRGVDVREGDIISFPAINTQIVGVVEKIKVKAADPFQTILFKSPVNIYELRFVEIILNESQQ